VRRAWSRRIAMHETPETPGDRIRSELAARGWTQERLATILGRHRPEITGLVSGRRGVTGELAIGLAEALGGTPEEWLGLESARVLGRVADAEITAGVRRRLRLFELAPVQEMQRRGWIPTSRDPEEIERDLCEFFDIPDLEHEPDIGVSARRPNEGVSVSPEQRAWAFRARQIARAMPIVPFDPNCGDSLRRQLRRLAAYPDEIRHVPTVLANFGIRFVIVEGLPGGTIDGASMWLDEHTPIVAMTMRYDRIDWFWFTLCHEISHVLHGDGLSIDSNLAGSDSAPVTDSETERRANEESAHTLVPHQELVSFIQRVGPLYSQERVIQFAKRIKIHPGIVVGQLHHRREIKPSTFRGLLVKVREHILKTAVTDGWGRTVGMT
jgi:HTH-type transcriptional regulator/antitoxin HigA